MRSRILTCDRRSPRIRLYPGEVAELEQRLGGRLRIQPYCRGVGNMIKDIAGRRSGVTTGKRTL